MDNRKSRQRGDPPHTRPDPALTGDAGGARPDKKLVDEMIQAYRAQRYEETLALARHFVEDWPRLGLGWNVLAASQQALGNREEAADTYRRAITLEPGNPDAHNNLGNVLRELGEYAESARMHARAAELRPDMPQAFYNLGLSHAACGAHEEAARAFEQAIRIRPDVPDAHNHLGNQLKAQGRLSAAVEAYQRALAIEPEHAGVLSNLASAQSALGALDEAEQSYRRALQFDPRAADVLSNFGTFLMDRDRLDEAESCYREAIELNNRSAELYNNLGVLLHRLGRLSEAENVLRRAAELNPPSLSIWHNLGDVVMDAGRLDEAEEIHCHAVALAPDSATAHRHLGVTLAVLGRPGEAEAAYRRALELQPDRMEVYYRLAEVKRFEADDADLKHITALLHRDGLSVDDRAHLHYAAGKAYADAGEDFDASFRHYEAGASARRSRFEYDVRADEACFSRIAEVFSAETVDRLMALGHDSSVPIFVVGMPRSGTTMVENLLAGHSRVHGAGERFDIDRLVGETGRARGEHFPDWVPGLDAGESRRLGRRYADTLAETAPGAARIIDKMPNNFRYLGLIAGILPHARIVHVRRDPVDTCVSCFTHLFENEQFFSYDLVELGRFYRAYATLMDHWRRVLPAGFLLTVCYESIIDEPEPLVRSMLEHCGLEWEPACLDSDAASRTRAVATASLVQVRQRLHRGAIGRWKAYADHLQPLLDALGDLASGDNRDP